MSEPTQPVATTRLPWRWRLPAQTIWPGPWRGLLRLSWMALAFTSLWSFGWVLVFMWRLVYSPPPRLVAGFAAANLTPGLYFWVNSVAITIVYLSYFVCALLLFLRRTKDRMAWFVAVFLMAFGTANAYPPAPEFLVNWTAAPLYHLIPYLIHNFLAWPLLVAFFALYPDGIFVPRWMRYVALYCFFFSLAWGIFPQAFVTPSGWAAAIILASVTLVFGASLYAQVARYRRHATPLQRQQIKWMVYSIALIVPVTLTLQITGSLLQPYAMLTPAHSVVWDLTASLAGVVFALLPLAVGVAILRYRLWDIDVLIRRTLVYGVLTVCLALIYFGSVVGLQRLLGAFTGQGQNPFTTVVSTLAIAVLFTPLRRRIQDTFDHRFYRRKYNAEQVLAAFGATVRNETDLERLCAALATVIQQTVQPASLRLWLKPEQKRPTGPASAGEKTGAAQAKI